MRGQELEGEREKGRISLSPSTSHLGLSEGTICLPPYRLKDLTPPLPLPLRRRRMAGEGGEEI